MWLVVRVCACTVSVCSAVNTAARQRCRPPGVVGEKAVEFGGKRRIVLRIEESRFELLERRHEDLGYVAAAEPAKATV